MTTVDEPVDYPSISEITLIFQTLTVRNRVKSSGFWLTVEVMLIVCVCVRVLDH